MLAPGTAGMSVLAKDASNETAARQRATALLEAIGQISSDPIYAKDVDGRFLYANRAILAIIGKTADQVLGHTDLQIHTDPKQAAIVMANDQRIMQAGVPEIVEETWDVSDRGTRTYRSTKTPLYIDDGSLIGIICLSDDITELRRIEAQSEAKSAHLAAIVTSSADAIISKALDGKILSWNPGATGLFGYLSTEMVGQSITRVIPSELIEDEDRILAQIRSGQRIEHYETQRLAKDGRRIDVSLTISPIRDAAGRIIGASKIARDITERKQVERALMRAEKALRENEERLRFALEAANLGSWDIDLTTGKAARSLRHDQIFGYPELQPDWSQNIAVKHILPEDLPVFENAFERSSQTGDLSFEARVRWPDQSVRWIAATGRTVYDDEGRAVRLTGVVADVTERKETEMRLTAAKVEAERANVAKSKFLAAASHDLRQPVQSLTLLLSLIEGQVADRPKAANYVDKANASLASINGLLAGILDISRLDAGVITPAFSSVDLGELISRLAGEYAPRAAADGLVLRRNSPRALRARTDVALLERILRNLIENALRYTAKGGVLIGMRQRGDWVRLDVIDTGMGIAPEHQAEIFEEFRQLNNPARDSSKGLGLGLAIVSRLTRLIGSEVQVASRLGRGTRFSLLLPIEQSALMSTGPVPSIDDPGGRILIIEDNPTIREAYEIMLADWGYETLSAASGEEALARAAAANWEFDAIVADHRLGPGLTGSAAALEIARRAGRRYPTMLVTGDTSEKRLAEVSSSGFALLHKPVDARDLRRTLASLLRQVDSRADSWPTPT